MTDSNTNRDKQELSILAQVADWAWQTDQNFTLQQGEAQIGSLLGANMQPLLGQNLLKLSELLMLDDEEWRALKESVSAHERFANVLMLTQHLNDAPIMMNVCGAPQFSSEHNFLGYRGTCTAIHHEQATRILLQYFEQHLTRQRGSDHFEFLVRSLATISAMDRVVIARVAQGDNDSLHTMAVWSDGRLRENFSYPLEGTACAASIGAGGCFYEDDLQRLFPADNRLKHENIHAYRGYKLVDAKGVTLGVLAFMSHTVISKSHFIEQIFRVMAERVQIELERLRNDQRQRLQASAMNKAQILSGFGAWQYDLSTRRFNLGEAASEVLFDLDIFTRKNRANTDPLKAILELVIPSALASAKAFWNNVINNNSLQKGTFPIRTSKGTRWLTAIAAKETFHCAGTPQSLIVGVIKDASEERAAQQQLRLLTAAVGQSSNAISITDLSGDIIYANPAFKTMTGYSISEALGKSTSILRSGLTPDLTYTNLWTSLKAGRTWRGELNNRRKDGALYWASTSITPLRDSESAVQHYLSVQEDISIRKQQDEKLVHQAHFDALTNLPNRLLAYDRLNSSLKHARRSKNPMSLMFLDLDNFKQVNDSLGHDAGDQLLINAAKRLQSTLRDGDTVARLGGDEFLIILESADVKAAELSVGRIMRALEAPMNIETRDIVTTASIGITIFPLDGDTPEQLMRNADSAMYKAKEQGKNTFQFFTEAMNEESQWRLMVETELRQALARDEIFLVYQPIVDAQSGAVVGAEALVRWQNAELGQMSPLDFIPLAEELGLIVDLGEFIVKQAAAQCANWQKTIPDFFMAINISPKQLNNDVLKNSLSRALKLNKLSSKSLVLEVTEGVLVDNVDTALAYLNHLSEAGMQLAIDDFGTGYSSLSYLKTFPFDRLKIDRSFVSNALSSLEEKVLVQVMIDLAHQFGMTVVAEGVETKEQLALLQTFGADHYQGYLFSRPLAAEEATALISPQGLMAEEVDGISNTLLES